MFDRHRPRKQKCCIGIFTREGDDEGDEAHHHTLAEVPTGGSRPPHVISNVPLTNVSEMFS